MNRRTMLRRTGMALVGFGASGCATRSAPSVAPGPVRRLNLPLVDASWGRVIRTTVGLRPHRASGFVVRADKLDDRTLIHNYGHGGAGISTSWGSGFLAAELASAHLGRRAAVIGCGAVGLTAARQLQRRGFDVTIYAKSVPPDTTSNMALAGFTPTSGLLGPGGRTAAWDAQFRRAAEIAYEELRLLVGRGYGVSWITSVRGLDALPQAGAESEGGPGGDGGASAGLLPDQLRTGRVIYQPGEHPLPYRYASSQPWLRIEPSIYLDALVRDFLTSGGRLVIRSFDTPRDLLTLGESLIVNCTGLGARDLFGDEELTPLKGQLTLLVPQPEITYRTSGGVPGATGGSLGMNPRSDGLALGSTSERGVWSLEPNEDAIRRVVEGHIALFAAISPPVPGRPMARVELPTTPTDIPSVESFFGVDD